MRACFSRTGVVLWAAFGFLCVSAPVRARVGVPASGITPRKADRKIIGSPERLLQDLDLPTLTTVGNNGGRGFPLGECQGDCDNDRECQDGLVCVQRSAGEAVPGCVGFLMSETDFCVKAPAENDATVAPTLQASVSGTSTSSREEGVTSGPTTVAPTNVVTQSATTSATATLTAAPSSTTTSPPTFAASGKIVEVTTAPTEPTSTVAPTSTGTAAATFGRTSLATTSGSSATTTEAPTTATAVPTSPVFPLQTVGNDGNFPAYPLSICEGDCDVDADCIDELICFQRVMDEPVPGCEGVGDFSIDYCVDPLRAVKTDDESRVR